MTIKELKEILNTMDENKKVFMGYTYSNSEIKGYYLDTKSGEEALMLTELNVQPRK